jgi:hypothetical protein
LAAGAQGLLPAISPASLPATPPSSPAPRRPRLFPAPPAQPNFYNNKTSKAWQGDIRTASGEAYIECCFWGDWGRCGARRARRGGFGPASRWARGPRKPIGGRARPPPPAARRPPARSVAKQLACPAEGAACNETGDFAGPAWGHVNVRPTTINWFLNVNGKYVGLVTLHWYKV